MHFFWSKKSPIYRSPTINTSESRIQAEFIFKVVVSLLGRRVRGICRRLIKKLKPYRRQMITQENGQLSSAVLAVYKGIHMYLVILNERFLLVYLACKLEFI